MSKRNLWTVWGSVAGLLSLGAGAWADVVNGDFEDGLTGWSIESGNFTVMEDATGNYVAYSDGGRLRQIFEMPLGALTLSFQYAFYQYDNPYPDTSPYDYLSIYMQDPETFANLIPPPPGYEGFPSFYNEDHLGLYGVNFDYVSVGPPDPSGLSTVTVDVTSLPPRQDVRLDFGLFDYADNGRDSFLVIDNVVVTVPEPASGLLWALGGLAIWHRPRTRT